MLTLIFAVALVCLLIERVFPGWAQPQVPTWWVRVTVVNVVQLGVVLLAGITWERWLIEISWWRGLRDWPPAAAGLVAYFVATFVFYWWHRWRHESNFLWRDFHQIHHSPQRIEVVTSFYKHPVEMVFNSVLGAVLVYPVLGLTLNAAAVYTACTALGEFFYHTNLRTPRWVGFVFQRPEMHRIHHQYGRHLNNYGDITWWDMLFGTYENPAEIEYRCGFDSAQELQLGRMLRFEDVHRSRDPGDRA